MISRRVLDNATRGKGKREGRGQGGVGFFWITKSTCTSSVLSIVSEFLDNFFEDTTNCHPNEIPSKIPPTPFNPIVHNKHSIEVDRHITGDP